MLKKKALLLTAFVFCFVSLFYVCSIQTFAASRVLSEGMNGSDVTTLQKNLRTLGYLKETPTGYYGSLTKSAVKRLQDSNGLDGDGIAGSKTITLINKLIAAKTTTTSRSSSSSGALKEGMSGSKVTQLQSDLKKLGYLSVSPTGYYGSLTTAAVKKLQKKYGLEQDGVAGNATLTKINKLLGKTGTSTSSTASTGTASRGSSSKTGSYLVSWFGGAENILKKGDIAEVYDIRTGRTFKIKRTYGHNHADCETLTAADTKVMKSIYGGDWSWDRRPIIVTVNGRKLAASMAGMPHAGVEGKPADTYVSSRSGGYGGGDNLDAVKGNNMSGVFDVHFLNSRTHGTNKVDTKHQQAIKNAAEWAEKNDF